MFKDIDKIFCINLTTSIDRKEEFSNRFPELTKSDIFEWYTTERDVENPKRGCHNSHKNILDMSKKRNYSNIIIFEDDANLLVSWEEFINVVNNIKYPDDWKAIQLGYLPFVTTRVNENDTVIQINCSVCMHCYLANVKTLEMPDYIKGVEIDSALFCPKAENYLLNKPVIGSYGIFPKMLVKQNSWNSTISNGRNLQGRLYYDRDILIKLSLICNYMLILGILIAILLISGIVLIIMYFTKSKS